MDDRKKPRLGTVQEILLIPLYARAVENRKEHALLRDARAEEIVASIDYDFERFDGLPSLPGALPRTPLFDWWVADFLSAHPDATVVEIGTGLNTRHERVDNGRARWFDLDLPDVIGLRRNFFTDSPRRPLPGRPAGPGHSRPRLLRHSGTARRPQQGRGPHALVLPRPGPTGRLADWPTGRLADWRPGGRVLASHTLTSLPEDLVAQLPLPYQQMVSAIAAQRLPQAEGYRLSLLRLP